MKVSSNFHSALKVSWKFHQTFISLWNFHESFMKLSWKFHANFHQTFTSILPKSKKLKKIISKHQYFHWNLCGKCSNLNVFWWHWSAPQWTVPQWTVPHWHSSETLSELFLSELSLTDTQMKPSQWSVPQWTVPDTQVKPSVRLTVNTHLFNISLKTAEKQTMLGKLSTQFLFPDGDLCFFLWE